jgi:hypothetical protein
MNISASHSTIEGRNAERPRSGCHAALDWLGVGLALAMILTVSGCASHPTTQAPTPLPCKVAHLKGRARWRIGPDGEWRPVKQDMRLPPLAVIETAATSQVDLIIGRGAAPKPSPKPSASALGRVGPQIPASGKKEMNSLWSPNALLAYSGEQHIRIWDNTRLMLCHLTQAEDDDYEIGDVELDLQAGHIFGTVKKLPARSRYTVRFPTGVAQIRGTTFDVNVDGIIKVLDGSIYLTYKKSDGESASEVIMDQQMFDARTGVLSQLPQADKTGIPLAMQGF